jgi:hypothetical protein
MKKQMILLCVGVIIFAVFIFNIGSAFLKKAHQSEVRVSMGAIVTALEIYHKENATYASDFKALGYSPEGKIKYQVYLSADQICPEVRKTLKDSQLPFAETGSYRIVAIGEGSIFVKDKDQGIILEKLVNEDLSCASMVAVKN